MFHVLGHFELKYWRHSLRRHPQAFQEAYVTGILIKLLKESKEREREEERESHATVPRDTYFSRVFSFALPLYPETLILVVMSAIHCNHTQRYLSSVAVTSAIHCNFTQRYLF